MSEAAPAPEPTPYVDTRTRVVVTTDPKAWATNLNEIDAKVYAMRLSLEIYRKWGWRNVAVEISREAAAFTATGKLGSEIHTWAVSSGFMEAMADEPEDNERFQAADYQGASTLDW